MFFVSSFFYATDLGFYNKYTCNIIHFTCLVALDLYYFPLYRNATNAGLLCMIES